MLAGMAIEVSVIVPVLNGASTIGETLDALAVQESGAGWEVVIADNGSSDGTLELVRQRVSNFPARLRVVDASAVGGAGYARNAGVLAAVGRYVAFCDADDMVGSGWIESIRHSLMSADAVGGPLRELRKPHDPKSPVIRHSVIRSRESGALMMACLGNFAMRREVFIASGGLDISMTRYGGEDNEYAVRLVSQGVAPLYDEGMVLFFRRGSSWRQLARKAFHASRGEVDIWRRHPERFMEENSSGWIVRRLRRVPLEALGALRSGGIAGVARVLIHASGVIYGQISIPRNPVTSINVDAMDVPNDISVDPGVR